MRDPGGQAKPGSGVAKQPVAYLEADRYRVFTRRSFLLFECPGCGQSCRTLDRGGVKRVRCPKCRMCLDVLL